MKGYRVMGDTDIESLLERGYKHLKLFPAVPVGGAKLLKCGQQHRRLLADLTDGIQDPAVLTRLTIVAQGLQDVAQGFEDVAHALETVVVKET